MRNLLLFVFVWFPVWVHADEPLKVASLSTVLSDIAENVGGDKVKVEWILKPDKDPHAFQPSPSDVQEISQARLVLASGKGLEGYLTKLEQSASPSTRFLIVGDSIPSLKMAAEDDHGHSHGHDHDAATGEVQDPHWWHSIRNVKIATNLIRDAFIDADSANASVYKSRATAYQKQLDDLAKWTRNQFALLPADQRKLVTSHDAFQYLAKENGFTVYAVEGLSTADQPNSREVATLIQTIKDQHVKAVFSESAANPKVVQEITQETGAKLGGELFADGLGGKEADSYIDMMRANISTLVNSLK